jgi:hypothetical protein
MFGCRRLLHDDDEEVRMISVGRIRSSGGDEQRRVSASVTLPNGVAELWFEVQAGAPPVPGDAFAAALLRPAMRAGRVLSLEDPVSPELKLELTGFIQDLYRCWDPTLHRVEIHAPVLAASSGRRNQADRGAGVFFSGGVDSFFSFLRHAEEIDSFVTVQGFDIALDEKQRWEETVKRLSEVAIASSKRLRTIRTNLRELTDAFAPWRMYQSGALAAAGHLLGANLSRMYIGSSHSYAHLFPWGSHPLLDHRWSNLDMEFVHDGGEATRVEKVALVAQSVLALRHLRVCWKNVGDRYNCGRCEKCIRTMVNLSVVGKLGECAVFSSGLDLERVRTTELRNESEVSFARENVEYARLHGGDPALIAALDMSIEHAGRKRLSTRLKAIPYKLVVRPIRKIRKIFKQTRRGSPQTG